MHQCETQTFHFSDDGSIPNSLLPLVVFRECLQGDEAATRATLKSNDWSGVWVDGIYEYHHYHSTSHEVLCILQGSATLQLGGKHGQTLQVNKNDVIVIPAGVGHKLLQKGPALLVMGAYAGGREWDMNSGEQEERPQTINNIRKVPLPRADPMHGADGPLIKIWS